MSRIPATLKSSLRLIALSGLLMASQERLCAGNAVLDWNEEAVDATRLARNPPPLASLMYATRSEEHTSELQSLRHLVCRLLLEKKKTYTYCCARIAARRRLWTSAPPRRLL